MTSDSLDILVISDLHAHDGDPNKGDAPSHFSTNILYDTPDINPIRDVAKLIKDSKLKVDWIFCPGDLGDKAHPASQKAAWDALEKIRNELGAKCLIGTAGNHDVDSRRVIPDFDPKSSLQLLDPTFPINVKCYAESDRVYSDRYWSKNFVCVPFDEFDCSLVIVNSCAFHGYASAANRVKPEHINGKLSPLTLTAIRETIENVKTRLNILLVHHHPIKIPHVEDSGSLMNGGDLLLDALKSTNRQWLLVHGHQHVPSITYADAGQFAPIVFSSGSISAQPPAKVKGGFARNQVHHISIDLSKIEVNGPQIYGKLTSWVWAFQNRWQPAHGIGVIPHRAGFGYRFDAITTRDAILASAKQCAPQLLHWTDVLKSNPNLDFLIPEDHLALMTMLKQKGAKIDTDDFGMPTKLESP